MPPRPAWCWRTRGVRTKAEQAATAQEREQAKQAKQEAELSVAPRLLRGVGPLLRGRRVSGDARSCQQARCRQSARAGGAYRFAVKANQPALLDDVTLRFGQPPPGERFAAAGTLDTHGGRLQVRHLRASAALAASLRAAGWAAAGLVREGSTHVRWPQHPAQTAREQVRSFLTSLPDATPAATLLRQVRAHWHSENRVHSVRDVPLGEDACQVRSGRAPQALAPLRTAVVGLLHQQRAPTRAARLRANAWAGPAAVLDLLGLKL